MYAMSGQDFRLQKPVLLLLAAALASGCGSSKPPTSSPGTSTGDTITGRERIGWDQPASGATELSTFRYAIYVDGTRSEIADITCTATAGTAGFPCSGRLPSMSPGIHVLEIAAFIDAGGIVESARSAQLRVTVAGATRSEGSAPLLDGEHVTTSDGVQLTAVLIAEGLEDVTDISLMSDGRVLIAERGGRIRILNDDDDNGARTVAAPQGLLTVAPDPDFARTGHLFLIHSDAAIFRLSRYRLAGDQLVERMVVLRDVPASSDPAAVLRVGPDRKLYAAFDDGGSREAAARLSEWSGKILRLNPDGGTPDDQPAASPVFWAGLGWPRGLDWSLEGVLWVAEQSADGSERIRGLATGDDRPRRAGQRASYALPDGVGASSVAFYRGETVPQFRGNMFIAARTGGYLLRVQFDQQERTRAVTTEKLLEGRIGSVRSVLVGAEGALLVATDSAVWRFTPSPNPQPTIR